MGKSTVGLLLVVATLLGVAAFTVVTVLDQDRGALDGDTPVVQQRPRHKPRPVDPQPTPTPDERLTPAARAQHAAQLLLVGAWRLNPAQTREANGKLTSKEAQALEREITSTAAAMAVYRSNATLAIVETSSGRPLADAQWKVSGMDESSVVLSYVHGDGEQTHQRVMIPAYATAATQVDSFVMVWERNPAIPAVEPVVRRPDQTAHVPPAAKPGRTALASAGAAGEPAAAAPSRQTYAFENDAAQGRWDAFKEKAAAKYQKGISGCDIAQACTMACSPTDATCPARCAATNGCADVPMHVP